MAISCFAAKYALESIYKQILENTIFSYARTIRVGLVLTSELHLVLVLVLAV